MAIFTRICVVCLVMIVASCATARTWGNFLEHTTPAAQQALARDAAAQLQRSYAPAVFALALPDLNDDDSFGRSFLTELRGAGFAVTEGGAVTSKALVVHYVVDEVETGLSRTMLLVQRPGAVLHRMTRAYLMASGKPSPAGAWTRQTQ